MTLCEIALDAGTAPAFATVPVAAQRSKILVDPSRRVLRNTLLLNIQQMNDGSWLATNPQILTHGVGDTPERAAEDFRGMMIDLFKELVRSENVLAPHLKRELDYLRGVLVQSALT